MLQLRNLIEADFPLLVEWLAKPHVKEWWNDGDDTLEKVARHYSKQSPDHERFILLYRDEQPAVDWLPIGYLQYEVDESGIASIDLFIGADEMVNRGIGTQAIKLLLEYIRARHHPLTVTIDPSPANTRAIRCYQKVGFRHYETVQMASGEMAYMMKIEYQNSETLKTKEGSKWDS